MEEIAPVLAVAGPYEIVAPDTGTPRSEDYSALPAVLSAMKYEAGLLSAADNTFLETHKLSLPDGFQHVSLPTPKLLRIQNLRVLVLLLPDCTDTDEIHGLADQLTNIALKFRAKSDLVVAVSPLGLSGEKELLRHMQGVDILLGSGPGYGFSSRILESGKTIWSRPFTRGKTLNIITLYTLPSGDFRVWRKDVNFHSEAAPLDDSIRQDTTVMKLLESQASSPARSAK